jgi:hypothetical protein
MEAIMRNVTTRIAFDFDVGDIDRSPCRDCFKHRDFPGCMDDCPTLDRFQRTLADTVSSARDSSGEDYKICRPAS